MFVRSNFDTGSTVTISSPHFYQSDDALWQMFDGISDPKETPEKYETYMYVEPYTGAALSLHKRIQVGNIRFNEWRNVHARSTKLN